MKLKKEKGENPYGPKLGPPGAATNEYDRGQALYVNQAFHINQQKLFDQGRLPCIDLSNFGKHTYYRS